MDKDLGEVSWLIQVSRTSNESQEFVISLTNLFLPQAWNYQALPMCPFLRPEQQIPSQSSAEKKDLLGFISWLNH